MNEDTVKSASDLFGNYRMPVPASTRKTERGEFLKRFAAKTGRTIPFIALKLQGVPTEDLYAFEKQCDSYKGPWSKAFFGALKPRR